MLCHKILAVQDKGKAVVPPYMSSLSVTLNYPTTVHSHPTSSSKNVSAVVDDYTQDDSYYGDYNSQ